MNARGEPSATPWQIRGGALAAVSSAAQASEQRSRCRYWRHSSSLNPRVSRAVRDVDQVVEIQRPHPGDPRIVHRGELGAVRAERHAARPRWSSPWRTRLLDSRLGIPQPDGAVGVGGGEPRPGGIEGDVQDVRGRGEGGRPLARPRVPDVGDPLDGPAGRDQGTRRVELDELRGGVHSVHDLTASPVPDGRGHPRDVDRLVPPSSRRQQPPVGAEADGPRVVPANLLQPGDLGTGAVDDDHPPRPADGGEGDGEQCAVPAPRHVLHAVGSCPRGR